jgi:uncharacterized membrane protein
MSNQETASNERTVAGVGIIVAAFNNEGAGDEALKALKQAKKQKQVYFEDAAVIRQDATGQVHYHETGDMSTGKGAGVGALIGGLVGILGGPAGIAIGASAGAAVGAAAAHGDAGFADAGLKQIGVALKPGTSALTAITSLRDNVAEADARAAVQQLADGISEQLAVGNDVAYGLAITEEGVAVVALAADDKHAQVLGVVSTEEGVAGVAAVVTEEGVAVEEAVVTEEGAVVRGAIITEDATVTGVAVAVPEEEDATADDEGKKEEGD